MPRSAIQLTEEELVKAKRMFELMEESQGTAGAVEIMWIGIHKQLPIVCKRQHATLPENFSTVRVFEHCKEHMKWDGVPDNHQSLSREDWFGLLRSLHTLSGYLSSAR